MSQIDDVTLMAYVDGELDAGETERMARALARDPALNRRAERLRAITALSREAFARDMDAPIPDQWVSTLAGGNPAIDRSPEDPTGRGSDAATPQADVSRLTPRGSRVPGGGNWSRMAIAASVALILLATGGAGGFILGSNQAQYRIAGQEAPSGPASTEMAGTGQESTRSMAGSQARLDIETIEAWISASLESTPNGVSASMPADALAGSRTGGSEQAPSSAMRTITITPTATYLDEAGRFCREFHHAFPVAGDLAEANSIACREESGLWRLQATLLGGRDSGRIMTISH